MSKKIDNRYNRFMMRKRITIIIGAVAAITIGYMGAEKIYTTMTGVTQDTTAREVSAETTGNEVTEVIFADGVNGQEDSNSADNENITATEGQQNGSDISNVAGASDNNSGESITDNTGDSSTSEGNTQENQVSSTTEEKSTNFTYSKDEISKVRSKIKSSAVKALVLFDSKSYNGYSDDKVANGSFAKGDEIEILRDRGSIWYKVKRISDGFEGWVSSEALTIPKDPATNTSDLSTREKECYVNSKDISSKTNLLVWVDIDRQETNIFTGTKNKWSLTKSFTCATGLNISPTVRGLFEAGDRGDWFYTERFASGAKYWTRFSGAYLFHSVSMDKDKNVSDPTLGKRVSNGCVRLAVEDAKWIYDNVTSGSKVYIY